MIEMLKASEEVKLHPQHSRPLKKATSTSVCCRVSSCLLLSMKDRTELQKVWPRNKQQLVFFKWNILSCMVREICICIHTRGCVYNPYAHICQPFFVQPSPAHHRTVQTPVLYNCLGSLITFRPHESPAWHDKQSTDNYRHLVVETSLFLH